MKKYFKVLLVLLVAILLVGCSSNSEKDNNNDNNTNQTEDNGDENDEVIVRKCTLSQEVSAQGYTLNSTYEIHAKGQVVEKVITKEIVNSSDQVVLNYFQEQLEKTYNTASEAYGVIHIKLLKVQTL